jgi:CheY-like chemotaxis protein
VNDDPASRLTLKTILEAGGYNVASAASAAEAYGKMDDQEYELVLSALRMESPEAGFRVLAHARMMEYRPATAILTASYESQGSAPTATDVLIEPEDVPGLLTKIANLIGSRATRRLERELRLQHSS